jgi:hypothetical protein
MICVITTTILPYTLIRNGAKLYKSRQKKTTAELLATSCQLNEIFNKLCIQSRDAFC